jgi:hypothetical protein
LGVSGIRDKPVDQQVTISDTDKDAIFEEKEQNME